MVDRIWTSNAGELPLIATAIHDGHDVRPEVARYLALGDGDRLREEDPHTGSWARLFDAHIVGTRSRFEVDLNRPADQAVYRAPDDAWGLQVWKAELPDEVAVRSLEEYHAFYAFLEETYSGLAREHGRFVVLDLHTYCHMREGPGGRPADPEGNPQVNVGTGTMGCRDRWAPVIDRFLRDLAAFDFPGGRLDVRENIKFRGGNCARWTHQRFPDAACVLAIEFKKFFMDEWTGIPSGALVHAIGEALLSTTAGLLEALESCA